MKAVRRRLRHSRPGSSTPAPARAPSGWKAAPFPLVGLAALVRFLARVVPKPSRARYPCQRVAAPLASGFVLWLAGVCASALAFRTA